MAIPYISRAREVVCAGLCGYLSYFARGCAVICPILRGVVRLFVLFFLSKNVLFFILKDRFSLSSGRLLSELTFQILEESIFQDVSFRWSRLFGEFEKLCSTF